ncbi:hypothetical protein ACIHCQ_05610 [Streptomyces sp. NPDC052236]|uniref:hypothetical protein n=1 Tax=Streptomyces sp. NPDC052236 TaxID=3365686 RepID=UPI0037D320C7
MLEEKINSLAEQGPLTKEETGHVAQEASPVLATPSAFLGGAALVTGAFALGKAVG